MVGCRIKMVVSIIRWQLEVVIEFGGSLNESHCIFARFSTFLYYVPKFVYFGWVNEFKLKGTNNKIGVVEVLLELGLLHFVSLFFFIFVTIVLKFFRIYYS
jgi:hypothetical protein